MTFLCENSVNTLNRTFFTAVSQCSGLLRKQGCLAHQDEKVTFVRSDWRILIVFVGFLYVNGQLIMPTSYFDKHHGSSLICEHTSYHGKNPVLFIEIISS